jgi:hypothetical protein
LLEATCLDEAVNLQGEAGFQELLFGMRKAEIGKDVSTAFLGPDSFGMNTL